VFVHVGHAHSWTVILNPSALSHVTALVVQMSEITSFKGGDYYAIEVTSTNQGSVGGVT